MLKKLPIDTINCGDSEEVLKSFPNNSIDLIVTSPPYADSRKKTYGGIPPNKYVEWFLPKSEQMLRVLKPSGTFILNIKEYLSWLLLYHKERKESKKHRE